MPTLEYNFSDQHLELIRDTTAGAVDWNDVVFDPTMGDYIRMSIFGSVDNFIDSFYSNLSDFDESVVEVNYISVPDSVGGDSADTTVISNPSGTDIGFDSYPIFADDVSLNQYCVDAGYAGGYESVIETVADMYYVYDTRESISFWSFDGHLNDIVGGNDGTLVGDPEFVDDDERGTVLQLDGNDSVATSADSTAGTRTYSWWQKSAQDSRYAAFGHGGISTGAFFPWFDEAYQRPLLYLKAGYYQYWEARTESYDNVWHHWTLYLNFTDVVNSKLYIDGIEINKSSSETGEVSGNAYAQGITLGATTDTGGWNTTGSMKNFGIWQRELTESEITDIFTRGIGWSLEQQVGTSVASSVECYLDQSVTTTQYDPDWSTVDFDGNYIAPQLRIYKDSSDPPDYYLKPNEALEAGNFSAGNYQLRFDFFHNPFYIHGPELEQKYYFYITEISPSRKEVRLIIRNGIDNQISFNIWESQVDTAFLNNNDIYLFDFVLVLSNARNIPIVNYRFDTLSDPFNVSLILKLYVPLPADIITLTDVTIERELFTTQIEDIWYKTEDYIVPTYGDGLENLNVDVPGSSGGVIGFDDVE